MTKKEYFLRYYPDPVLRKHSEPIEEITEEIKDLTRQMLKVFDDLKGIGLSAIQVGVPVRMFVLRNYIILPDGHWVHSEPVVFINPKIVWKSEETYEDTEGCLSIPGLSVGPIERPVKVRIEALNINGKPFIDECEGINARVRFHENDHINGMLFIDRLPTKIRKKIEPELLEVKKKYYEKENN